MLAIELSINVKDSLKFLKHHFWVLLLYAAITFIDSGKFKGEGFNPKTKY